MPSLAVAEALMVRNPDIKPVFFCSHRSDELDILRSVGMKHVVIHAGKFPRGISPRILTFPILFIVSFVESMIELLRPRPALIVSKGGFVSAPICLAGRLLGIPVILHSSDSVPSLSDRLIGRLAQRVCTGFPIDAFPPALRSKAVQTGNPVRSMIAHASRAAGQRITGFSGKRPVVMIIGGSQGSVALNESVDSHFEKLIDVADVIHVTGEGKGLKREHARYFSRPSVLAELPHLYALADVIVTRAGAGVLSEIASLKKAAIVVPLRGVAHDHQQRNAEFLQGLGAVLLLPQEELADLMTILRSLLSDGPRRAALGEALSTALPSRAASGIADVVLDALGQRS